MSGLHSGILVAHERRLVDTRLATGLPVTLLVENVTYLSAPHHRVLRNDNPVVRHLFVVLDDGRLELHYNPGIGAHAVHGLENLALAASSLLMLASVADHIRRQRRLANAGPDFSMNNAAELPGFSYHPVNQVIDGVTAARYGAQTLTYGKRGLHDSAQAIEDLTRWLRDRPVQGYYVVRDGRPADEPLITDPIHFHDLRVA